MDIFGLVWKLGAVGAASVFFAHFGWTGGMLLIALVILFFKMFDVKFSGSILTFCVALYVVGEILRRVF